MLVFLQTKDLEFLTGVLILILILGYVGMKIRKYILAYET
jgi:hypothetical protein